MGEWIPCSDGMPGVGERVLVCTTDGSMTDGELQDEEWFCAMWDRCFDLDEIVAWMPMPAPYVTTHATTQPERKFRVDTSGPVKFKRVAFPRPLAEGAPIPYEWEEVKEEL